VAGAPQRAAKSGCRCGGQQDTDSKWCQAVEQQPTGGRDARTAGMKGGSKRSVRRGVEGSGCRRRSRVRGGASISEAQGGRCACAVGERGRCQGGGGGGGAAMRAASAAARPSGRWRGGFAAGPPARRPAAAACRGGGVAALRWGAMGRQLEEQAKAEKHRCWGREGRRGPGLGPPAEPQRCKSAACGAAAWAARRRRGWLPRDEIKAMCLPWGRAPRTRG
jgi:hypothetical protein